MSQPRGADGVRLALLLANQDGEEAVREVRVGVGLPAEGDLEGDFPHLIADYIEALEHRVRAEVAVHRMRTKGLLP